MGRLRLRPMGFYDAGERLADDGGGVLYGGLRYLNSRFMLTVDRIRDSD